jgi:hypothetical protein
MGKQAPITTKYFTLIKHHYTSGDTTALFQSILTAAGEIGMPQALAILEACVIEKRLLWLENHTNLIQKTDNPIQDGYRLFYENYLGVSIPQDGDIVRQSDREIIMRWWNRCPTLEACQKLGLDTRQVCRRTYHQPVQIFLSRIHPNLRFGRNYEAIRPYCDYCEEMITLEI